MAEQIGKAISERTARKQAVKINRHMLLKRRMGNGKLTFLD